MEIKIGHAYKCLKIDPNHLYRGMLGEVGFLESLDESSSYGTLYILEYPPELKIYGCKANCWAVIECLFNEEYFQCLSTSDEDIKDPEYMELLI